MYPSEPTCQDNAILARVRTLGWIEPSHLEIVESHRCKELWEYAGQEFLKMDSVFSVAEKLTVFYDCFSAITNAIGVSSDKNKGAGADDTLPILIYVIIHAAP